jgi:hypothetical protein
MDTPGALKINEGAETMEEVFLKLARKAVRVDG